MFSNLVKTKLDDKGRLTMPTRQRGRIADTGDQVVLTVAPFDNCLLLYSIDEWNAFSRQLEAMPNANRTVSLVQRRVLGHASYLTLDNSGRITIDKVLRDSADLEKEVAVVWQGNKFEIWHAETWDDLSGRPIELSDDEMHAFSALRI